MNRLVIQFNFCHSNSISGIVDHSIAATNTKNVNSLFIIKNLRKNSNMLKIFSTCSIFNRTRRSNDSDNNTISIQPEKPGLFNTSCYSQDQKFHIAYFLTEGLLNEEGDLSINRDTLPRIKLCNVLKEHFEQGLEITEQGLSSRFTPQEIQKFKATLYLEANGSTSTLIEILNHFIKHRHIEFFRGSEVPTSMQYIYNVVNQFDGSIQSYNSANLDVYNNDQLSLYTLSQYRGLWFTAIGQTIIGGDDLDTIDNMLDDFTKEDQNRPGALQKLRNIDNKLEDYLSNEDITEVTRIDHWVSNKKNTLQDIRSQHSLQIKNQLNATHMPAERDYISTLSSTVLCNNIETNIQIAKYLIRKIKTKNNQGSLTKRSPLQLSF